MGAVMNETNFLFEAVVKLIGGLKGDIRTAMVAVVSISFLIMGLDLLKIVFLKENSSSRIEGPYMNNTLKANYNDDYEDGKNYDREYKESGNKYLRDNSMFKKEK